MSEQKPSLASAVALIVVGLLIFIPSGLCTGLVAITPLVSAFRFPRFAAGAFDGLMSALLFGGPFIAFGGLMIWKGIVRLRARRASEGK